MGRTKNSGLTVPKVSPQRKELSEKTKELSEINSKLKINDDNQDKMVQPLVDAGVKFTKEDVLFVTHDEFGQMIWLEKGNSGAGLEHILYSGNNGRGHLNDFTNMFGISESQIPQFINDMISNGKVVNNAIKTINGRLGYEKIYKYKEKYFLLSAIGLNGFIVTAYPINEKTVIKMKRRNR